MSGANQLWLVNNHKYYVHLQGTWKLLFWWKTKKLFCKFTLNFINYIYKIFNIFYISMHKNTRYFWLWVLKSCCKYILTVFRTGGRFYSRRRYFCIKYEKFIHTKSREKDEKVCIAAKEEHELDYRSCFRLRKISSASKKFQPINKKGVKYVIEYLAWMLLTEN